MILLSAVTFVGVLKTILYIIIAILALMFMIVVHEFGHYIAGVKLGFKINDFAIGFGKPIFKRKLKNGVTFSIRPIPLGGFCGFEGEDEESDKEVEGAFNNMPPWKRLIVLFNGAFFNFISAVIILTIFFSIWGQPLTTVVGVFSDSTSVTAEEGFKYGDAILSVNGHMANVLTADDSAFNGLGDSAEFKVLRDGKVVKFTASKGDYTIYDYKLNQSIAANGQTIVNAETPVYVYSLANQTGEEEYDNIYPQYYDSAAFANKLNGVNNLKQIIFVRYLNGDGAAVTWQEYRALTSDGGKTNREIYYVAFNDDMTGLEAISTSTNDYGEQETKINLLKGATLTLSGGETLDVTKLADITTGESFLSNGFGISSGVYLTKLGFFRALGRSLPYTFFIVFKILASLGQLITGKIALSSAGGPITVITTISQATQAGFYNLFWVICILSANLAVMNLLPFPALDGSKMVFTTIEWIRGKPINRKVEAIIHTVGLILLFSLTIFLDIFHLVS